MGQVLPVVLLIIAFQMNLSFQHGHKDELLYKANTKAVSTSQMKDNLRINATSDIIKDNQKLTLPIQATIEKVVTKSKTFYGATKAGVDSFKSRDTSTQSGDDSTKSGDGSILSGDDYTKSRERSTKSGNDSTKSKDSSTQSEDDSIKSGVSESDKSSTESKTKTEETSSKDDSVKRARNSPRDVGYSVNEARNKTDETKKEQYSKYSRRNIASLKSIEKTIKHGDGMPEHLLDHKSKLMDESGKTLEESYENIRRLLLQINEAMYSYARKLTENIIQGKNYQTKSTECKTKYKGLFSQHKGLLQDKFTLQEQLDDLSSKCSALKQTLVKVKDINEDNRNVIDTLRAKRDQCLHDDTTKMKSIRSLRNQIGVLRRNIYQYRLRL